MLIYLLEKLVYGSSLRHPDEKEDHTKLDDEIIKKEKYYKKLMELKNAGNKSQDALKSRIILPNNLKLQTDNTVGDKTGTDRFMPVGLIKSPNSGDFCKYNLYDELYSYTKKKEEENLRKDNIANKQAKEKAQNTDIISEKSLLNKQNLSSLKEKILDDFIAKIKYLYL